MTECTTTFIFLRKYTFYCDPCFTRQCPSMSSNMAVHLDVFSQLALKTGRQSRGMPLFPLPLNKQNTLSETLHIQNHFRVPCERLLADQFPSLAPYWANCTACKGGVPTLLKDNFSKYILSAKTQLSHSFWTEIETPEQNIAHSALGIWGAPPAVICITVRSLKREHVLKWKPAGPAPPIQQLWKGKHSLACCWSEIK